MARTRSLEMFIAIFVVIITIPILYASLPLLDFSILAQEPFIVDLPREDGAHINWSLDGTNNNTRTDEIFETETYTIGGSQEGWNLGTFVRSTSDRRDNSGILGLGYMNGTGTGDLRLFLRFDRTSGVARDYSGFGNDGDLINSPIRGATGTFSTNSFDFQRADDDRIRINNSQSLNQFQNKFTIEHWTYFDAVSQTRTLVRKQNAFRTFIATSGGMTTLRCTINGNTFNTGVAPTPDGWHHIVCTYDGSEVRVYLDGAIVGTFALQAGNINNNGNPVTVASNTGGSNSFDGRMDDVRIYRRAFTQSDVDESFFQGTPFMGNYTSRLIDNQRERSWRNVTVNASIPTGTSGIMDVVLVNNDGTEDNRFSFNLNDGIDTYVIPNMAHHESPDVQLEFDDESSRANSTWEIESAQIMADLSLGASLIIRNTSKSFSPQFVGEGIFNSDIFAPENVDEPELEVSLEIQNITTSALIKPDTSINITLQTSDNNFTTVKDERDIVVQNDVTIVNDIPFEDFKYIRFDARLVTNDVNETPALERLKIFTIKDEREQFPSGDFNMERVIILFVIAAFVFLLFELLIHRD